MTGKRLAILVLCLWFFTHYGYDPLASLYSDPSLTIAEDERRVAQAARDWFYVLRGFEGTFLFALVGLLAGRPLVWAVCLWGAIEELQTAVCGMAYPLRMPPYESFRGLCGNGWYSIGLFVSALIAVKILDRGNKK
jgi:hypothetical protein